MSLSSAKAKLDAQGGDPVTGYISKADHQDSYTELVDDTALTGSTTAEALDVTGALTAGTVASDATVAGTGLAGGLLSSANPVINGTAAPGTSAIPSRQDHVHASDTTKVTKAASSTDNALARFDGTGGDVVQNSGITVDDSGYVSSDLTVSKASPVFHVTASSGNATFKLTGAAGTSRDFFFYSGTTLRWAFRVNSSAESGSNAGSNFTLSAYNDAGDTLLGNYLSLTRAEGRLTLSQAGATAGLELGASGPRVMSGTGSPEGVVSAPINSIWNRSDGDTLGDFVYHKRAGTGNTGWIVSEGDTGWRNVSASLDGTFLTANPNATLYVRRTNSTVELSYKAGASPTFTTNYGTIYAIPSGFRPGTTYETHSMGLFDASSPGVPVKAAYTDGNALKAGASWVTATQYWGSLVYTTTDAWPSSLPGVAA